MTILIVDDHAAFRTYVAGMLAEEGFEVVGGVADGETAIEEARRLEPDAVLLDVQLGDGIDGFEVARRMAGLPHPPRVVLASSRERDSYSRQLETAPVRGFIAKDELTGDAIAALIKDEPA